jgi:hypothetical protein
VHRAQRLANVVDGDDPHQLDVGVNQQAPDHLRAAVTRAADDGGLESLHRVAVEAASCFITLKE